jgi:hypothetical protein
MFITANKNPNSNSQRKSYKHVALLQLKDISTLGNDSSEKTEAKFAIFYMNSRHCSFQVRPPDSLSPIISTSFPSSPPIFSSLFDGSATLSRSISLRRRRSTSIFHSTLHVDDPQAHADVVAERDEFIRLIEKSIVKLKINGEESDCGDRQVKAEALSMPPVRVVESRESSAASSLSELEFTCTF